MIETKTRDIDGFSITISQMPAMASLKMSARLGKLFGGPLSKALATLDVKNLGELDVNAIGAALASLFDGVTESDLEDITKKLLAAATVDGKPAMTVFDVVFAGKVTTIYKVLGFALEVNYGSFFDVLRALGAQLSARRAPPSSSEPVSK